MRRHLAAVGLTLVALVGRAGVAWAHQEITPTSFAVGKPIFLSLSAANERQSPLTSISVTAPQGLQIGEASREPVGWKVEHATGRVTWSGAGVAPGRFEEWGFEVEAPDQPGTFTFRLSLRFGDGRTEDAQVPVTVVAAGASAAAPAPASAGGEVTSAPATPTTSDRPGAEADGERAESAAGDASARDRADLALGVGGGGLVLGLIALVVAGRRQRSPTADVTAQPEEQTW